MNNKEIEEQEYLDNGINEKEEFDKFIKFYENHIKKGVKV